MYKTTNKRSMLLIYNIYRLMSIVLLFGLFWVDAYNHVNQVVYCGALLLYAIFGLVVFYIDYKHTLQFKKQLIWSGTIDIIALVLLINAIGYMQSGLGVLLNALIAMLSILLPGRLAIFFAAVASCMLLGVNIVEYEYLSTKDVSTFFSTGIYGAGFFATALTALYFANWVRLSEGLAKDRGRELKSMQRINEYIVGRLQYGVVYVDSSMRIQVINTAARQFFNLNEKKNVISLRELSYPLYQKYLQFLVKKKQDGLSGHTLLEKPYLQVHFFPASSAVHPAILIILDDMAVISQQVQQLKLASLGRFSASIAHELRNPLAIVAHAVQLMGEEAQLSKEDTRLRELIINNCNRMNSVIQNVLQVSKRQQAKSEPIELTAFLKHFKKEFCLINQCKMNLVVPKNKKKAITFDKSQLEQILVILCDNSMQHGRNKEGEVNITITVKQKNSHLILQICDEGAGIPVELQKSLFEPFVSSVATGHGMGLFIAKELCEVNQAELGFVALKRGCCFAITFNLRREIQL